MESECGVGVPQRKRGGHRQVDEITRPASSKASQTTVF